MSVRTEAKSLSWAHSHLTSLALATMGAIALALLSKVSIPLPNTNVPITLQVLGVLMLGGILGPRLAAAAVAEYLLLGLCGVPVYASWTAAGPVVAFGPTGGYLVGFLFSAWLFGAIYAHFATRTYGIRILGAVLAGIPSILVIYLLGASWMAILGNLGATSAFVLGILPFIIADTLKLAAAASILALRRKGAA